MPMKKKDIRRNMTKAAFIDATKQIIAKENIASVNARKIGDLALYNSATIYNYFNNLDHLIILASVEYIKEYFHKLQAIDPKNSPLENYIYIWDSFIVSAEKQPEIYYKFFFNGNISLDEVFEEYFTIYPDEKENFPDVVESFMFAGDIYTRNRNCMKSLFTNLTEDVIVKLTQIHIALFQSYIIDFKEKSQHDFGLTREAVLEDIKFTMKILAP